MRYSAYTLYHICTMAWAQAIAHAHYSVYALLKIRKKKGVIFLAPQLGAITLLQNLFVFEIKRDQTRGSTLTNKKLETSTQPT